MGRRGGGGSGSGGGAAGGGGHHDSAAGGGGGGSSFGGGGFHSGGGGPSSLFILSERSCLRRMTKFLIEWPPFEYTVLLTIIANCVVLAMEEHLPNGDRTVLAQKLVRHLAALIVLLLQTSIRSIP